MDTAAQRVEAAQAHVREARAKLLDLESQTEAARSDYRVAIMLLSEAQQALRGRPDPRHYRTS